MEDLKQNINSKINTLNQIRGVEEHSDIWRIQTLIQKYYALISIVTTFEDLEIHKIVTNLESLEEEFKYLIEL